MGFPCSLSWDLHIWSLLVEVFRMLIHSGSEKPGFLFGKWGYSLSPGLVCFTSRTSFSWQYGLVLGLKAR